MLFFNEITVSKSLVAVSFTTGKNNWFTTSRLSFLLSLIIYDIFPLTF